MTKVWIVNDGGHDYSAACKFGDLEFLFKRERYPFGRFDVIEEEFEAREVSQDDFLVPSGALFLNMTAMACWIRRFGYVKLLLFNAKTGRYVEKSWKPRT